MSQGPAAGAPPHEDVLSADGPPEPQGSPAAGIGDSSATEEWRRPGHSDATQIALHALVVIGIGVAVLAVEAGRTLLLEKVALEELARRRRVSVMTFDAAQTS